ncbi:MAG: glycosyl hydrolase 53 family protein [Bacteroidales bacterium]|nr:glycosyl hydrolase 53 family protein [Bacteroidales bacterium]MCM1416203.1 glycosyl hydrolase 53 family protein [bacterium]MCM1424337.1 glycosyl hydrolase 53 family protein [bacterium]
MKKQARQYLRRSLCGILSAAMILTGSALSGLTAYAAEPGLDEVQTYTEDDSKGELPSEESKEIAESTDGAGDQDNAGGDDADQNTDTDDGNTSDDGDDGQDQTGDGETTPDDGKDEDLSGEDGDDPDKENAGGGVKPEDPDEGEEKVPVKTPVKKSGVKVMSEEDETTTETNYGMLVNGDFESDISNEWNLTDGYQQKSDQWMTNDTTKYVSYWVKGEKKEISVKQTIENVEPGHYTASVYAGGSYAEGAFELNVKTETETLGTADLGKGGGWNTWDTYTTNVFEITGENNAAVTITIEGTLLGDNAEESDEAEIDLDDVVLSKVSYTYAELQTLIADVEKLAETDYTTDSWAALQTALTAAKVIEESSDATAITSAYVALLSAKNALVPLGQSVTFYYYFGDNEENEEIGLYHWVSNDATDAASNLASTAETASWKTWDEGDTYLMTKVDGYAGWYRIPLVFQNNGANAGFEIITKSAAEAEGDTKASVFKCDSSWNNTSIYTMLTSGENTVVAVKNGKGYAGEQAAQIMRNITLNVYSEEIAPVIQLDPKSASRELFVVDETTGDISKITPTGDDGSDDKNNVYELQPMADSANWYTLTFSAPGGIAFDSKKICNLYEKSGDSYSWLKDLVNGLTSGEWEADFTPVFDGKIWCKYEHGTTNASKKLSFYSSKEEADPASQLSALDKLKELVEEAKKLEEKDYKRGWEAFQTALTAAEKVVADADAAAKDETKTAPTDEEIEKAYDDLKKAMDALVPASVQDAEIKVDKVALTDDFITGADLSSYIALRDSGTVFKDENGKPLSDAGFFNYLHDGGLNWVRIRVWNDPYTSSGNGYGGGNNDLEKAIELGQLATNAGMKVLIDFHYSDFWADPSKQKAPKAWAGYSVAQKEQAVYEYTRDSLNALRAAGVDVGMVQVGNETNNGIAGETTWENMAKIFSAGSKAVREFDKDCLVAVHFTDPHKGYGTIAGNLDKYKVDYDVFASSFYAFGHGDTTGLRDALKEVVETYGKKVMAAETSWPTTEIDGDGKGMIEPMDIPANYADQDYGISVQGQADEIRDVVSKVNEINDEYSGQALGVFYWEPAWISPYYIKDEEGNDDESLYKKNFELWEKYGSGWASSYAAEYDPDDAGVWYGGSAMDHRSWFDFDGTALPTAKIFGLIRTGATAEEKIASVSSNLTKEVSLGEEIIWDDITASAKYNTGKKEELKIVWEQDEKELVNTDKAGEYTVHGVASVAGSSYKITLTVKVLRSAASNLLVNPDFENGSSNPWDIKIDTGRGWLEEGKPIEEAESVYKVNSDGVRGKLGLHFYSAIELDSTVSQTVKPEPGSYTFGSYIQGNGADKDDVQYAFVRVLNEDGSPKIEYKAAFTLDGYLNWSNPEIKNIVVEEGESLVVGLIIKSTQTGAWGTMDDFYLYGTHTVSVSDAIENGTVETSVVKAESGEKVNVTVTPNEGYYLDTMTVSGASIDEATAKEILTSTNGTVTFRAGTDDMKPAALLTYAAEIAEAKTDSFIMPTGNVEVSATFKSVFGEGAEKIALDAKGADGKYLVQVDAGVESADSAGETPIPAQFHTGKNVTPAVELTYKGYKLTTADYTVSYQNNKNLTTGTSKAKLVLTAKNTSKNFIGTRMIEFEIKEDTRKEFSAKKLKVVFEASDKNGRTDKPAQAVYYLGKEKEVEPTISLYAKDDAITDPAKEIDPTLYKAYFQNNKKLGKATLVVLPTDKALNDPNGYREGSITATYTIAKCPVNQEAVTVEISSKLNYYTGKKVEPSITVKYNYTTQDGTTKPVTLTKGIDYTVAYSNNINASVYETKDKDGKLTYEPINANKAPTLKITGKGNFSGVRSTIDLGTGGKAGTQKYTFAIYPKDLSNTTITAADLAQKTSAQAPKITVKDGAKAVAANQYEITEIKRTHDETGAALAADKVETIYSKANGDAVSKAKVKAAGTYAVKIAGKQKANYAGERENVTFRVVDKAYLISNAKITVSGKFYYNGNPIKLTTADSENAKANLTVKAGTGAKAVTLTAQTSKDSAQDGYYVSCANNINAGRATVTITGTGKYVGTKTATFTINKRTLVKEITKENEKDKKGALQIPKLSAKSVYEKQDGVWTPVTPPEDDPEWTGSLINADITEKTDYGTLAIPYTGYAPNPELQFSSINCASVTDENPTARGLASGDYTVTYAIGKWTNGVAPVTATIKGKGNYSGTVKLPNLFTVTGRYLNDFNIEVSSASYNGKALKPAVIFRNKESGKVVDLKLNTAYSVTYKNNKDTMGVSKKQPELTVKVKGNSWFTDNADPTTKSRTIKFTIDQTEIVKTNVEDVKFQSFLGKVLKPKVTVKVNGRKLKEGKDYTLSYENNGKRSGTRTATVKITGKGNYFTRRPIEKTFVIK